MNPWGVILAALAFGTSLATLAIVLAILRRPINVDVRLPRPRPPLHGDRRQTASEAVARRIIAALDDELPATGDQDGGDEWPAPDPWPPHSDPAPGDERGGPELAAVPGGLYVHQRNGGGPEILAAPPVPGDAYHYDGGPYAEPAYGIGQASEPGHPYPVTAQQFDAGHPPAPWPGAPYPTGPAVLRTYATPDLGRIAPGADGTWNPREDGPARPYVAGPTE